MLKVNTSAVTRRVNAWWEARRNIAVTIAPTPMMRRKPRFNVIANTLRAHSAKVSQCTLRVRGRTSQISRVRTTTNGLP